MRTAAIVALLVAAGPAGAQVFSGTVVEDHTGNPLASVELRIGQEGARQLTADLETDGAGRFQAEGIPPGEYRIEVSKPNYAALKLHAKFDAAAKPLALRLVRFGAISGRVADADGHSVPGATIQVMSRDAGGAAQPFGSYALPDDQGQYRVHGLPAGEYAVAVAYGDSTGAGNGNVPHSNAGSGVVFYPNNQQPKWFSVAGGEDYEGTDFLIAAASLVRVSGSVQPSGKAYAVALTPVDQPLLPVASKRLSGNSGAFELAGIPPGSYELYAAGPVMGYGFDQAVLGPEPVFGKTRVDVGVQDVEGVTVTAERGRSASFILRTAAPDQQAAACPPSATLKLTAIEATGARLDRTVEANFAEAKQADVLVPIRYRISADDAGGCYAVGATVDMAAAGDEPIAVTMAPGATLRGRLVGAARAADFVVALAPEDPDAAQPVQVAYPDAEARFGFTGLRPGRYWIAARRADAARARWVADSAHMTEIEVRGGANMEIDLPEPGTAAADQAPGARN
jgi:hypothetical protein